MDIRLSPVSQKHRLKYKDRKWNSTKVVNKSNGEISTEQSHCNTECATLIYDLYHFCEDSTDCISLQLVLSYYTWENYRIAVLTKISINKGFKLMNDIVAEKLVQASIVKWCDRGHPEKSLKILVKRTTWSLTNFRFFICLFICIMPFWLIF